eukprot:1079928-Amphidinium_carterae.1
MYLKQKDTGSAADMLEELGLPLTRCQVHRLFTACQQDEEVVRWLSDRLQRLQPDNDNVLHTVMQQSSAVENWSEALDILSRQASPH